MKNTAVNLKKSVKKSLLPLNWLKKYIQNFEEITGSVLLVLMCFIAILQAGSRFLSKINSNIKPVSWTQEACTLLFIFMAFTGASLALKTGDHFAVEVLQKKAPPYMRSMLGIFTSAVIVLFSVLLIFFGFVFAKNGMHAITPSLQIPKPFVYAAVPLGGMIMLVRSVQIFLKAIYSLKKSQEDLT